MECEHSVDPQCKVGGRKSLSSCVTESLQVLLRCLAKNPTVREVAPQGAHDLRLYRNLQPSTITLVVCRGRARALAEVAAAYWQGDASDVGSII